MKLFDMKKFQQNVNRELKRQRPERNKLESQVGKREFKRKKPERKNLESRVG